METTITATTWISPFTGREEPSGYRLTTETGLAFGFGDLRDAQDCATGFAAGAAPKDALREGRRIRLEASEAKPATEAQIALITNLLDGRTPEEATDLEGSATIPAAHQMTTREASWLIGQLTH